MLNYFIQVDQSTCRPFTQNEYQINCSGEFENYQSYLDFYKSMSTVEPKKVESIGSVTTASPIPSFLEDEDDKYGPKLYSETKSMTYQSESPINATDTITYTLQGVEWSNQDGLDFNFSEYNSKTEKETIKQISLCFEEIELLQVILNKLWVKS